MQFVVDQAVLSDNFAGSTTTIATCLLALVDRFGERAHGAGQHHRCHTSRPRFAHCGRLPPFQGRRLRARCHLL
jgi:hypothetical protein